MRQHTTRSRAWKDDVETIIKKHKGSKITLDQLYQHETTLRKGHKKNNNIRAKIRQVAQVLRDDGMLEFLDPGVYRIIKRS